jgi:hypothetical protein
MSALLQAIQALVFALASAAFAHFGVTLKEPPHPRDQPVHRTAAAVLAPGPNPRATPCPLAARQDRA